MKNKANSVNIRTTDNTERSPSNRERVETIDLASLVEDEIVRTPQ